MAAAERLLIVNAEVDGAAGLDVRCRRGLIAEVGPALAPAAGETTLDASGGALLPGLHDHHIHLAALAAADRSVRCGPPDVRNRDELALALASAPGEGWIRAIGYHESVAGMLERGTIDALQRHRPVRIQHRSGKMWFVNSKAVELLGLGDSDGRLFRRDRWLRERLPAMADWDAALQDTSRQLARYGVTGVTETTPSNQAQDVERYRRLDLCQRVVAMGDETLEAGTLKVMLDDAALPTFEQLLGRILAAHERARPVAVHCVTRTELVFALSAFRAAGTVPGDRIEHASIADDATLRLFRNTHLTVVTQPNFIAERGDQYLADVARAECENLYRCQGFLDADVPLGGGTDAPFGDADPWAAMRAAVARRSASGIVIGAGEALTPERALALFTTPPGNPGGAPRRIQAGAEADLCLLDRPWRQARLALTAAHVRATLLGGRTTYNRANRTGATT